jgi:hypothetical protein
MAITPTSTLPERRALLRIYGKENLSVRRVVHRRRQVYDTKQRASHHLVHGPTLKNDAYSYVTPSCFNFLEHALTHAVVLLAGASPKQRT